MDFVSDSLAGGRRLKWLVVTDDFSHECVDTAVDHVARCTGHQLAVRTDQGPEFTSRAVMAWVQAKGVRHILDQPGKPMQNFYIEGFNGKLREPGTGSGGKSVGQSRCGSGRILP